MADSDRPTQQAATFSNASHHNPASSLHTADNELRIQIEGNENQQRLHPLASVSNNYDVNNGTGVAVQQNLTSILNQARSELERRTVQTRQWGVNLTAVLQSIRQPPILAQQLPVQQTENGGSSAASQINSEDLAPSVRILLSNENRVNRHHALSTAINLNGTENSTHATSISPQIASSNSSSSTSLENASNHINNSDQSRDVEGQSIRNEGSLSNRATRPRIESSNETGRARNLQTDESALSEMLAQVPELRQFVIAVVRYIPFVLILLTKSIFDHLMSVLIALGVLNAFLMADASLQKQIARRAQSRSLVFLRDILLILLFVLGVSVNDQQEVHNLWLVRSMDGPYSFQSLLYTVWVTDHLLKLITVLFKNFIAVLPIRIIHYSRKGRFYMLIESASQLYRYLAPIRPWLTYLTEAYSPLIKVASGILYMAPKLLYLMSHLKFFKKAVKMFPHKVRYGSIPTRNDIQKAGDQCPICHDQFNAPVLLECKHIFCENCIAAWFRNESTCPMCRAKVVDDMSWLDGRTTQFIQLF